MLCVRMYAVCRSHSCIVNVREYEVQDTFPLHPQFRTRDTRTTRTQNTISRLVDDILPTSDSGPEGGEGKRRGRDVPARALCVMF